MKNFKRVLSSIVCLIIIISAIPLSVFAESGVVIESNYCDEDKTMEHIASQWWIDEGKYRILHCVVCGAVLAVEEISQDGVQDEYNNRKYQVFDESLTWSEAKEKCEQLGGHLVTINSEAEQIFLIDLIKSTSKKNMWIGAYPDNGDYKWITGEPFSYSNWAPGEPNNVFNMQNAAMMYTQNASYPAGTWNDENENGRSWTGYYLSDFGYICEWGVEDTNNTSIKFGADRFTFGEDITGYVGDEVDALVVYTSANENIASLNITSSNTDVVEIGTIEIGVGDYITTLENEHIATIPLKLKAEGTSTITITSPEGISENINVTVSKVPEVKKSIAIFSTEKSLTLKAGECMWLAFGLMNNKTGLVEENWNKMAIVVSDPSVVALSDYEETEYGYSLEVIGKKEGSTNLTITDTLSGTSTVITVTVYDNYIRSYSYAINDMQEFYPDTKHEKDIKTNIYNLNGLYVNNYACIPEFYENEFQVSFDVYNSQYYNGAVDIYDADGVWIDCEYIDRYSDITSLRDTGEQLFYLITDAANKRLLSYQSASFSKKTSINIKVPKGGYFTISNNMADSPGTFFANAFEILYDTTSDLIDFATSKASDKTAFDKFYKDATKSFAQNVIDARNETLSGEAKKKAMEVALSSLTSEIKKIQKKFVSSEAKDFVMNGNEMYSAISTLAENILNSYSINWKHLYQSTTGVAESMFIKFSGPAGVALKGMFAITKGSNKLLMAAQMSRSLDNTYATIYSSIDEGYINPHGIVVNTNGNVDSEAVLQVFKVSDNDTLEVVLNSANPLEKYELYNICFVKDDKLVQPSGKVKVHVPIPEGMNRNTCKIYRQESDDSWTILDAHIEENYLVFETDHFSLYSVIGDMEKLSISSLPNKNIYKEGDVLDTSGLALKLNDQTISRGFICEPTVLSEIGLQTITVKYGYAITEFTVNVVSSASYNINGIINSFGDIGDTVTVKLLQGTAEINSMQTASGSYHFADVAAGTYTLEISKPNHVTRTYKIVLNDTDVTQDVTIYLFGDLHVDGVVTASDALMALQAATGKITLTEEQQAAADVNGDESVAAGDALLILQYATRKIAQFPKAA